MRSTISKLVRDTRIQLEEGGLVGDRYRKDENGLTRPINPRPWHSYRGAKREIYKQAYRKLPRRRIDPAQIAADLAVIEARRQELIKHQAALRSRIIWQLDRMKDRSAA